MRLHRDDAVRIEVDGQCRTLRLCVVKSSGEMLFADVKESNVDARVRAKDISYISKSAGSLQKAKGRRVTIGITGRVRDSGPVDEK